MKPLITLSLALFAFASDLAAQELQKFAADITNITWDMRGTANLKHLRFDGEKFNSLNPEGEPQSAFDHTLLDAVSFASTMANPGQAGIW